MCLYSVVVCNTCLEVIVARTIGTNERFRWQKDDFWRVVDRGDGGTKDAKNAQKAIVSLLEMNPSHLPVIENAVARAAAVSDDATAAVIDDASANTGLLSTGSSAPALAIHMLVSSALGFKLACLGNNAAELVDSSDFR